MDAIDRSLAELRSPRGNPNSILVGQQHRGGRTVGFGDDPGFDAFL